LKEKEFEKVLLKCWFCVNQYEPSICPFYKLKEEVVKTALNCPHHKEPKTPEEILKVL
jgi:hypothetical protein